MNNAIGLIETKGLLPLIEATDAMAKAANVEIVKRIDIGGAYVTTVVGAVPEDASDLAVVAVSMGALTAPLLCAHLPVRLLVLLNAMIPVPGESGGEWWQRTGQGEAMSDHARRLGLDPADLEDPFVLYGHDVPVDLFTEEGSRATDQSGAPFTEPWPLDTWPDVPTRVVTGSEDRLFPRDFQHRLARERLGIVPDDVAGGHLVMLSRPAEVANLLDRYAAEVIRPGAARVDLPRDAADAASVPPTAGRRAGRR